MMKAFLTFAGIGVCVAIGWVGIASHLAHASSDPFPWEKPAHEAYDAARKDREVSFHEGRVRRDPGGAIGWSMLSGAYLARARENDSYVDATRSESAARKSLSLRLKGNLGGQTRLINALLQEHRFLDALSVCEKALSLWGHEASLTQLHADILIELGRYDEALKVIKGVPDAFEGPSGKAVIAHLASIQGHP